MEENIENKEIDMNQTKNTKKLNFFNFSSYLLSFLNTIILFFSYHICVIAAIFAGLFKRKTFFEVLFYTGDFSYSLLIHSTIIPIIIIILGFISYKMGNKHLVRKSIYITLIPIRYYNYCKHFFSIIKYYSV